MNKKIFVAIAVVMVLSASAIIYYAVCLEHEESGPYYTTNGAGKRVEILLIDKSIVQITSRYSDGPDFSIGNEVENIRINNLAVELKKYHAAHPDARYQVVSFGGAGASEINQEIKKAGIEIEHFWFPFSSWATDDTRVTEDGCQVIDIIDSISEAHPLLITESLEVVKEDEVRYRVNAEKHYLAGFQIILIRQKENIFEVNVNVSAFELLGKVIVGLFDKDGELKQISAWPGDEGVIIGNISCSTHHGKAFFYAPGRPINMPLTVKVKTKARINPGVTRRDLHLSEEDIEKLLDKGCEVSFQAEFKSLPPVATEGNKTPDEPTKDKPVDGK